MFSGEPRVVLVEPDATAGAALAQRLSAQRFRVQYFTDPSEAANAALASPPQAVVADLWMPGVSGVQLCRLLRSEPATTHVPVVLRAEGSAPRNRFWAERAGAVAYVPKGRIGELVRALNRALADGDSDIHSFFTQLAQIDVRDRIAELLDRALFESVIASEVRALGTSESFERLFDLLSQLMCQLKSYEWLALHAHASGRLALHCHGQSTRGAIAAARRVTNAPEARLISVCDEDALPIRSEDGEAVVESVLFGAQRIGTLALGGHRDPETREMVRMVAQELGGPLRMAFLVEEANRLAMYDPLTGIMNRRAFVEAANEAILNSFDRGEPVLAFLLDVDHFKQINDRHGHGTGDLVLAELGAVLRSEVGGEGLAARWGGEEFVVMLTGLSRMEGVGFGEHLRERVSQIEVCDPEGRTVPVTASIGMSQLSLGERLDSLIDRADQAMYSAKIGGRNRLEAAA